MTGWPRSAGFWQFIGMYELAPKVYYSYNAFWSSLLEQKQHELEISKGLFPFQLAVNRRYTLFCPLVFAVSLSVSRAFDLLLYHAVKRGTIKPAWAIYCLHWFPFFSSHEHTNIRAHARTRPLFSYHFFVCPSFSKAEKRKKRIVVDMQGRK